MPKDIHLTVDKAGFIAVGRIFKKFYKPSGSRNVIMTLRDGKLTIEFHGGGAELACTSAESASLELTARAFASLIAVYAKDRNLSGPLQLTLRPAFGEFATQEAGVKARYF